MYSRNGESLKFLAIGDVVSSQGCDYLRDNLPKLKREYGADFVIVNGENSAVGNGVTPKSAQHIFTSGADVITLGNHSLRRPEIADYLDKKCSSIDSIIFTKKQQLEKLEEYKKLAPS